MSVRWVLLYRNNHTTLSEDGIKTKGNSTLCISFALMIHQGIETFLLWAKVIWTYWGKTMLPIWSMVYSQSKALLDQSSALTYVFVCRFHLSLRYIQIIILKRSLEFPRVIASTCERKNGEDRAENTFIVSILKKNNQLSWPCPKGLLPIHPSKDYDYSSGAIIKTNNGNENLQIDLSIIFGLSLLLTIYLAAKRTLGYIGFQSVMHSCTNHRSFSVDIPNWARFFVIMLQIYGSLGKLRYIFAVCNREFHFSFFFKLVSMVFYDYQSKTWINWIERS